MRVIAGKHRGKRIETLPSKDLRPTMGRAKEALFNILSHGQFSGILEDADILDLYCGCGAFSAEALSRGAARSVLIDINNDHLKVARDNLSHLGESENAAFLRADSSNPPAPRYACSVAFMDPPYHQNLITKTLQNITRLGWLEPGAIVVAESHKKENPAVPEGYTILEDRVYGNCRIIILSWDGHEQS